MLKRLCACDLNPNTWIRSLFAGLLICLLLTAKSFDWFYQPVAANESEAAQADVVTLEDFSDIVTTVDSGFNDFSGNMGTVNATYVQDSDLNCSGETDCYWRFQWNFQEATEGFTGIFLSVFGLTETKTTFDGTIVETISFPEHTLDLNNIDGDLQAPNGKRAFEEICLDLRYQDSSTLKLRIELKDVAGGSRFTRFSVNASPDPQVICWDFRSTSTIQSGKTDLDLQHVKEMALIIERRHIGDGVENPKTGAIEIRHIWFTLNEPETKPTDEQALLDLAAQRSYQYFLDWSSRKSESAGIPQDRSTFGDLLTVGGISFGLPAHVIAAERGWITRDDAAQRVLGVLKVLNDQSAFGPDPVGKIGYRGWFYHFLGVDGRRKLNFDFPDTPKDESLNTVELSSIDTGLALMGILVAQSYFDNPDNEIETEIRTLAQDIYDRVEWDFMLDPKNQQFYLGWKPNEVNEGPPFAIPDKEKLGHYSGTAENSHTLDYYTDEALIIILLAAGSETHPVSPQVYHSLVIEPDENVLVKTWPGALFTYQFLAAFLDTRTALTSCYAVNWHQNSRRAIWETIEYAEANSGEYSTYGPDAWGISAAEGPFDSYHANGARLVGLSPNPEEDGTVTYYAMVSSVSFGHALKERVISVLNKAWDRKHWHERFGLPDAFHDQISEANPPEDALRSSGPWLNRALFAIDQGPMLLHLENERSGLIWKLLAKNPNIQRGLSRIDLEIRQIVLQGEMGIGDGSIKQRSNAWGDRTIWLHDGESRSWTFSSFDGSGSEISVRYSNDNFGPRETVRLIFDEEEIGSFVARDTGDFGSGWNNFVESDPIPLGNINSGEHTLSLLVEGGDGYGIEIDAVVLDYQTTLQCQFLPFASTAEN